MKAGWEVHLRRRPSAELIGKKPVAVGLATRLRRRAGIEKRITPQNPEWRYRVRILRRLLSTLIICAFVTAPATAFACTLWAAAGDSVVGGGTLLGKNYDWVPDHKLQLRILARGGYRVVSLYAVGNGRPGTRAGINEKGFVIVRASPPSYLEVPENYKGVTN